jgi:hypothetical protein
MSKLFQIYRKPENMPKRKDDKKRLQEIEGMFEGVSENNLRLFIGNSPTIIPIQRIEEVRLTNDPYGSGKQVVLVSTKTDRIYIDCELKDLGI